jgi:hypothetical protein
LFLLLVAFGELIYHTSIGLLSIEEIDRGLIIKIVAQEKHHISIVEDS